MTHHYQIQHSVWRGASLRIVHLTDLHVHPRWGLEYYRLAIGRAEESQPHLAVLTGDFIAGIGSLPMLREVIRPIAKHETFAVLGNHDYWTSPDDISDIIIDSGLRLLTNESVNMMIDGREVVVWGTIILRVRKGAAFFLRVVAYT